jgi:hypothetical protein
LFSENQLLNNTPFHPVRWAFPIFFRAKNHSCGFFLAQHVMRSFVCRVNQPDFAI